FPRRQWRSCACDPAIVVDGTVAEHLKVLRGVTRGRAGIGFVKRVQHAHALNRLLRDAVEHDRRGNSDGLENSGNDVNQVVELVTDAACVLDVAGPGDDRSLSCAAEVRSYLLGPLERRIKGPGPSHRHVRLGLRRSPDVIELELLLYRDVDALD